MNSYDMHISWIDLPMIWWMPVFALLILLLIMIGWQLRSLLLSRLFAVAAFGLLLAMPYVTQTTMAPLEPVALIITDQSPSMQLGNRPEQSAKMAAWLEQQLEKNGEIETQRYDIAQNPQAQTEIAEDIQSIMQQHNPARIAAVFLITDGEIADISRIKWERNWPPFHALLVGMPHEQQAYIEIDTPPPYAMTGDAMILRLRARWPTANSMHDETILAISSTDRDWQQKINLNEWQQIELPVTHQGMNRFVVSLPPFENAVFPATQTAVVDIQGIPSPINILWQSKRDMPPWLAALQDDPLVKIETENAKSGHFKNNNLVILDNPLTEDFTPALQDKMAGYLKNGGRILWLQDLPPTGPLQPRVQEILPVNWDSSDTPPSKLMLTPRGMMHPVTANIAPEILDMKIHSAAVPAPQSGAKPLITTENGNAILILSEYYQGRLASVLASDILTNDPELPRVLMRWLLHDPALSDHAITFREMDDEVQVEYLSDDPTMQSLRITRPDRTSFERQISNQGAGLGSTRFHPDQTGAYLISDGVQRAAYVKGNIMVPEFQSAAATSTKLAPFVQKSGGRILWISTMPEPKLRWVTPPQRGGADWLALHETRAFISTESFTSPLLPKLLLLLLIGSALGYAWWRETH